LSFVNFLTVTKGNRASQQGDIKTLSSFSKVGQTYLLDQVYLPPAIWISLSTMVSII
jgi:hypothetical protein